MNYVAIQITSTDNVLRRRMWLLSVGMSIHSQIIAVLSTEGGWYTLISASLLSKDIHSSFFSIFSFLRDELILS